MTEQQFQRKVLGYINKLPKAFAFKVIAANKIGIPDIVGVIKGRFVAIEVKKSSGSIVKKIQTFVLNKINSCGGFTFIVYPENFELLKTKLGEIK